jgi:hypothetical protein
MLPSRLPIRMSGWLLVLSVSAVVLLTATTLDYVMAERSESFLRNIDASAVTAALVAGLLFYRLLWCERKRGEAIRQRVEIIAQMNHHVRNAMQTILLSTHAPQEKNHVNAIDDSVQRIDWALKEILPKL